MSWQIETRHRLKHSHRTDDKWVDGIWAYPLATAALGVQCRVGLSGLLIGASCEEVIVVDATTGWRQEPSNRGMDKRVEAGGGKLGEVLVSEARSQTSNSRRRWLFSASAGESSARS